MTNKIQLIAILALTTILITGGFGLTQLAYSSGSSSDKKGDDKKGDLVLICHDDKEIKFVQQKDLQKQLLDHLIDPSGSTTDPLNQKPNHPASFVIANYPGRLCGHGDDDDDDDGIPGETTITLKKTITNDNGGKLEDTAFVIKLDGEEITKDIALTISPGTHTISETPQEGYSSVLISGDGCPSNIDESFVVEEGDQITCTIYNDDDFVEGQTGGDGIIFRNNSMKIQVGDNTAYASCDRFNGESYPGTLKNSCIEILDPTDGTIGIVDSALTSDTTIVLFSVVEADKLGSTVADDNEALTPVCTQTAIVQHNNMVSQYLQDETAGAEVYPSFPSDNNVVVISCPNINSAETYNVNYIMIDPLL